MLKIRMCISDECMRLYAEGHAGYAEKGSDVVCAAASVLVSTLQIALRMQLGVGSDVYFDDAAGGMTRLECYPHADEIDKARTTFRVISCGLESIAYKYPNNVSFELIDE